MDEPLRHARWRDASATGITGHIADRLRRDLGNRSEDCLRQRIGVARTGEQDSPVCACYLATVRRVDRHYGEQHCPRLRHHARVPLMQRWMQQQIRPGEVRLRICALTLQAYVVTKA